MNYTLTQAIDRTRDLSGAIKAADELERLTADTLAAKEHEVSLARQAHDKAVANQDALRAERDELAEHTASLVRKIGEPLELPEPESPFWRGEDPDALADRLMARSEEKMNGDEATR